VFSEFILPIIQVESLSAALCYRAEDQEEGAAVRSTTNGYNDSWAPRRRKRARDAKGVGGPARRAGFDRFVGLGGSVCREAGACGRLALHFDVEANAAAGVRHGNRKHMHIIVVRGKLRVQIEYQSACLGSHG
jgi:hypothetical protein